MSSKVRINPKLNHLYIDEEFQSLTKVDVNKQANSLIEDEKLFRKKRWNIMFLNCEFDKLYILKNMVYLELDEYINVNIDYGDYFLCIDDIYNIQFVHIMKKVNVFAVDNILYENIGSGRFWNGSFDFDEVHVEHGADYDYIPFNGHSVEIEIVYSVIKDANDLSGSDSKYGKGDHSSLCFCIICESQRCDCFNDSSVLFRTKESIAKQREIYKYYTKNAHLLKSDDSALKKSKGIKAFGPVTYTSASRITPPSMHGDMGDITHRIDIDVKETEFLSDETKIDQLIKKERNEFNKNKAKYMEIKKKIIRKCNNNDTRYKCDQREATKLSLKLENNKKIIRNLLIKKEDIKHIPDHKNIHNKYQRAMLKYGVYKNKYYQNIEGKQAVKYRKNWKEITKDFAASTYRQNMAPAMKHLNKFMKICNSSKPTISASKIQKAQEHLIQYNDYWKTVKQKSETFKPFSLGKKEHYQLDHYVDHMDCWGQPLGNCNEQGLEGNHKWSSIVQNRYKMQRGELKTKYFIDHMMLITCPLFQ